MYEWSAQSTVDPIPVAGAKGCWFWTPEGKRFLDFNSQLMCVNIGHGDERVIKAIQEQAETLAYANPFMATEPRARLGAEAGHDHARATSTSSSSPTAAPRPTRTPSSIARQYTGRHKILARYRSYHGGTGGQHDADRRSAPLGDRAGHARRRPRAATRITASSADGTRPRRCASSRKSSCSRARRPSRLHSWRPVTGTNGILVPPDGYLEGVRALCDKHGILLIADEVMSGFGRTGDWFAVDHWKVVPDIITMAKGLTSAYVPLGAVGMRRTIADHFQDKVFYGGLTYNSHPLGCADGTGDDRRSTKRTTSSSTPSGWAS